MANYKMPKCWLGKSTTVINEKGEKVGQLITEEMVNIDCRCENEMQAFFCSTGHLTECHVGKTCDEAECSHWEASQEDGFIPEADAVPFEEWDVIHKENNDDNKP